MRGVKGTRWGRLGLTIGAVTVATAAALAVVSSSSGLTGSPGKPSPLPQKPTTTINPSTTSTTAKPPSPCNTPSTKCPLTISIGSVNRLSVGADNLVPGDSVQRAVDLVNTGRVRFDSIRLTTTGAPATALTGNQPASLQIAVDRCSNSWSESTPRPGVYTYTCSGSSATVLSTRGAVVDDVLANLASPSPAGIDHLRV